MGITAKLNGFMRSMYLGRLLALFLILAACVVSSVYSAVNNAINYTKIEARVERIGIICRSKGAPAAEAVDCPTLADTPSAGKVIRNVAVYLRYTSPVDAKEHRGRVVAVGKRISQVKKLRKGDSLTIWAHDNEADEIKIY